MLRRLFGLFLSLCLVSAVSAQEQGHFVVLLIAAENNGGQSQEVIARLEELRSKTKLDAKTLPIRFMSPATEEGFDQTLTGLGVDRGELPVLGVCLWNNSTNLGPRRFVGDAFARSANVRDCPKVIQSYLRLAGHKEVAFPPFFMADTLPLSKETGLIVEGLRFEASGQPLFVLNFAVRVSNDSFNAVNDVNVRFYIRPTDQSEWTLVDQKRIEKIASHQNLSVDFIGNSKELGLVDAAENATSCQYKVEVALQGAETLVEEGVFVPSEEPVGLLSLGVLPAISI